MGESMTLYKIETYQIKLPMLTIWEILIVLKELKSNIHVWE